jgi:Flp pilus assembly pilin Flp
LRAEPLAEHTIMKKTLRDFALCLVRYQSGQSMIEYTVVCAALAIALFVPVMPGSSQTLGQLLAGKIRDLYNNLTFFLSLP